MLIISTIILAIIFILNIVFGMYYKFGYRHYWFFEMLHFVSGFFVAMFFSNFTQSPVVILIGLGAVVFLWELAEILIAKIPKSSKFIQKTFKRKDITPEWQDTILDIVLDFAGATTFLFLLLQGSTL